MKIKNLLIVPLLGAALVATSCSPAAGGSSTASSETSTSGEKQKVVTRVTVKAVQQAVQGDVLDFDTLVTVYYDDESTSKDYTLEVAAASKDLVTIDGKKATFVKEGTVNITVKAGEQSAKFSTIVISKLKKEANDYFSAITNNYMSAITEDGTKFDLRKVHRPNYVFNLSYPNQTDPFSKGHGILRFPNNGHTYEYTVASGAMSSVERLSNEYENYFSTMDLNARVLEGVTLTDEGGKDYVRIDSSLASEWEEYGYYNQVHFFVHMTTGLDYSFPYDDADPAAGTEYTRWESLNIYEIENPADGAPAYEFRVNSAKYIVAEHEPDSGYQGENDVMKEGTEAYDMTLQIGALQEDAKVFPLVEDYIADPDNEPVSKDFSAVQNYCEKVVGASPYNYGVNVQGIAFLGSSIYFRYNEAVASTESAIETTFNTVDNAGLSGSIPDVFPAPTSDPTVDGYALHNGAAYSYVKDGATNPANPLGGKSSIFDDADLRALTFAQLSSASLWGDNFYVTAIAQDLENHKVTYSLSVPDSLNFVKAAFQGSKTGRYIAAGFDKFWNPQYLDEILGYGEAKIVVTLDSSNQSPVSVAYQYQTSYFASLGQGKYLGIAYAVTISGVGEAGVDLSTITWNE